MGTKAQEIIAQDIAERLDKIAFHFEERDALNADLQRLPGHACDPAASSHNDFERAITRIQAEELATLIELVHLLDNVKKHFDAHGLSKSELVVVENFRPFRAAANYVNTHKHGTRGRNKASSKLDGTALFYEQAGKEPTPDDKLVGVCSLINYDGELLQGLIVVEALIRIWELFLRHHTTPHRNRHKAICVPY